MEWVHRSLTGVGVDQITTRN